MVFEKYNQFEEPYKSKIWREAPTFLENFAKNLQISGQNDLKFQNQGSK